MSGAEPNKSGDRDTEMKRVRAQGVKANRTEPERSSARSTRAAETPMYSQKAKMFAACLPNDRFLDGCRLLEDVLPSCGQTHRGLHAIYRAV